MKPPLLGAWARVLAGALLAAAPGAAATDGAQPRPADFFTDDAERMDELPAPQSTSTDACHPKCVWRCHNETCDTSCRPQCQAPKCVTSCKKIRMSTCREVCGRPRCAAVCPPSCEKHTCPECQMVCSEPECKLDCGQANNCESKCEDPLCSFECRPEECPEPKCVLTCEKPRMCTFRKWKRTLRPDVYHGQGAGGDGPAPFLGDKFLAWSGFGEV
ncbi:unnamed protein product, partial [Prorocentrum cordatum]